MSKSFGGEFIVTNAVRDQLFCLAPTTKGKPFIHLATVRRGLKEYVAYLDEQQHRVWIEEIDPKTQQMSSIKDNQEWQELKDFLFESGLLQVGTNREIRASERYAKSIGLAK